MPAEVVFDPDVFHGELTANRAQVFVRAPRSPEFADCTLHGQVVGPRCEFAHTLPAKFLLTDLGAGPTLLARTTITDPCYWTSDVPQLYDVHIELRRGSEIVASEKRQLGLRGVGARTSGELVREGKVWVPRCVAIELLPEQNLVEQLRSELLVGVCSSPALDLLNEASRRGAYLVATLSADRSDFETALRNLARWPAVLMAIIQGGENLSRDLTKIAPNLLLAQHVSQFTSTNFRPALWASVLWRISAMPSEAGSVSALPMVVEQPVDGVIHSAAEGRAACDRLQRAWATGAEKRQFAGYSISAH